MFEIIPSFEFFEVFEDDFLLASFSTYSEAFDFLLDYTDYNYSLFDNFLYLEV